MGGAALGADVTAGPRPIVPGSLGVFGGTFDPIHVAHLAVAEEAAEALGLERSCSSRPVSRRTSPGVAITPAEHRLAMVELAIAGNDRFAVDRTGDRPCRPVVHGRYARGRCVTRASRPRRVTRPDAGPVGRGLPRA